MTWRIITVVAILAALYFGLGYAWGAIQGFVTGQAQRFDPAAWAQRQLPDVGSWFQRLIQRNTPDIPLVTSYRVISDLNLRNGPSVSATKLAALTAGTQLQALGEKQVDEQGLEWIKVITVTVPPQQGWVANLPESLQKQ